MENQKFNVTYWLNPSRQKDGNDKLTIRISVEGKRSEIATNYYVSKADWDKNRMRVKQKAKFAIQINGFLDHVANEVNKHFLSLVSNGEVVSAAKLKEMYLGLVEEVKSKTVIEAFTFHKIKMQEKIKVGMVAKATLAKYNYCQGKVESFIKHRFKKNDFPLDELSMKFITEFEHFLLVNERLQTNSAHKYIVNFKRIMNVAVASEWISKNPFDNFSCSYTSPEREILTQSELDEMQSKKISIMRLAEVRDVFLFCCYTGFAYVDVFNFERDAVSIGIDGEYWLSVLRHKTNKLESVPLLPLPLEILERYKSNPHCISQNKLLPVNSNQKYNAYLKEVATICGIKKNLTTHIARHTFATTVTLSNGVPLETVSKMLGHKKMVTTQIYAKVLNEKVSKDMNQLKSILESRKTGQNIEVPKLKIG